MFLKFLTGNGARKEVEAAAEEQAKKKPIFDFERGDEPGETTPFSGKGKPLDALRANVADDSDHGSLFSKDSDHGSNSDRDSLFSNDSDHGSNSDRDSLFSNDSDRDSLSSKDSDYGSDSDRKSLSADRDDSGVYAYMYGERNVVKGDDDTSVDGAEHSRSGGNDGGNISANGSGDEHSKSVGNDGGEKKDDSKDVKEDSKADDKADGSKTEKKKPIWARAWESMKEYLKQNYLSEVQQNLQNFASKMDSSIDGMLGGGGGGGGGNNAYGMPEQMAKMAWESFKKEPLAKPTPRPGLKDTSIKAKKLEVTKETGTIHEEHKVKRQREDDDDEMLEENRAKHPKLTEMSA